MLPFTDAQLAVAFAVWCSLSVEHAMINIDATSKLLLEREEGKVCVCGWWLYKGKAIPSPQ